VFVTDLYDVRVIASDLTVLYEHKTRLETAVSQEKEITKKAKEGRYSHSAGCS